MDKALTVVSPILPGVPARTLIDLARALASEPGKAIVLSVVEVPEDHSLSEGVSTARRRRELLRRLGGDAEWASDVEFTVRAARQIEEGIRETVQEAGADVILAGWRGPMRSEERLRRTPLDSLILDPPCDILVFKAGRPQLSEQVAAAPSAEQTRTAPAPIANWPPKNILVPVRGGPHADLALIMAERLARYFGCRLTIMRIKRPDLRQLETGPPPVLDYPNSHVVEVMSNSVEEAIARQSEDCQLLIMGASARGPRSTRLLGYLPEQLADRVSCDVMIVTTAEKLSPEMFGIMPAEIHSISMAHQASISNVVDQWFAENTFHSHEFEDLGRLMRLKERQGLTISVALPALNEEATIERIITTIKQRLMDEIPLVDEMVVVDSMSEDRTVEIARSLGIPVFAHDEILPTHGSYVGKGEGLWKSLYVTHGDIVVWIDSDITDIHPKFVYGLVGPLLTNPRLDFVKGYYRRPLNLGGGMLTTGGGRVTELAARPLINIFYPQLSGLVQPLAGEMAGRRRLLEQLPFFTGYGVETGLLIDILEQYGLNRIGQTDLENRIHRNQDMISLSKMAFAIVQVVMRRLEDKRHIELLDEINTTMKLIHYSPEELFLEVKEIWEVERPPIASTPEYAERFRQHLREEALEPLAER